MTKPGDRVVLVLTTDEHTRLHSGEFGTVEDIDDLGTVHVLWDNGIRLGLVPGEDKWRELHPRWEDMDLVPGDAEATDLTVCDEGVPLGEVQS
jgi:hypothetical protein